MNNTSDRPKPWDDWLAEFKQRLIEAKGWPPKEARLRIRDAWVIIRDGRPHGLDSGDQLPKDAIPIFEILTPGGWKQPIEIIERLRGLVTKAMSSRRPPRDIVLGLLSQIERADGQDESELRLIHKMGLHRRCRIKGMSLRVGGDRICAVTIPEDHP